MRVQWCLCAVWQQLKRDCISVRQLRILHGPLVRGRPAQAIHYHNKYIKVSRMTGWVQIKRPTHPLANFVHNFTDLSTVLLFLCCMIKSQWVKKGWNKYPSIVWFSTTTLLLLLLLPVFVFYLSRNSDSPPTARANEDCMSHINNTTLHVITIMIIHSNV